MLKWTVSRSLSTTSSTPHGPPTLNKPARRPFRDLSNTPPTSASCRTRQVSAQNVSNTSRTTPARRRRCRSNGTDLRTYFQATKPHLRSSKRQSVSQGTENSPVSESFYQSTPRVDTDIGPLMYYPPGSKCSTALTLPTDPTLFMNSCTKNFQSDNELPQNVVNEARANLQSHVSDFFQQISMATSPEDVMEAGSMPLGEKTKNAYSQNVEQKAKIVRTPYLPKLAKITKIHARCRTPYHTKLAQAISPFKPKIAQGHTPLVGKLSSLTIDQDLPKYENMDNTVTEVLHREQEVNFGSKTVAEILLGDAEERNKILEASCEKRSDSKMTNHTYETIAEVIEEESPARNDSSISSVSQLLEDPSPVSWAFTSPLNDLEGEFTLKRQRGIRRKRPRKDGDKEVDGKRAKRSPSIKENQVTLIEAVNPNVKKLALETDLDLTLDEKHMPATKVSFYSIEDRKEEDISRKTSSWDLDSPKSSMMDDIKSPTVEKGISEKYIHKKGKSLIRCKDLRRAYEGPVHAYVKASLKNISGEGVVKRTAVHRATPNPVFRETLILPCPAYNSHCTGHRPTSLDIAVWHRDRRARRLNKHVMPRVRDSNLSTYARAIRQEENLQEATWHPLEAGSVRNTSTPFAGVPQDCVVSSPLSKDGEPDNNNSGTDDLMYLRHLELEPVDPLTGLPLHPGFTARGGRTPCTITRRLLRQTSVNQIPWGFSLSWGRPPRVERVDPGSPAERSGLRPGDHVVFVETTNVVTKPRDEILGLIQAATNQLVLEVYRKGGAHSGPHHRPSSVNATLQHSSAVGPNVQHSVTFNAEVFPNLAPDAPPEEELAVRETRYWGVLKSGHTRFMVPLCERRDVLSAADYLILFQNLDELLKLSEEIRDEGGGVDSYLYRVPKITAAYRRYLSGLQRACCLLVALRRNTAFAKLVCEPAVPHKRRPDLTGVLLLPLEHYREMTRLLGQASPRNCQQARDLAQGYREATANAGVMEPPRDTGRPLLSLQEVESRLVFARCKPFTLAMPGRRWLFGGALAKVEGRARLQPSWALLLTDLLVFARVSRDRVLFVTEEPLRLSSIAEACFTVRKRPTEFRLQVAINPNGSADNGHTETINSGGCSPHSRPRRRVLILRAPTAELKAVWHNLLQRQIIYVNTGCGLGSSDQDSPEENLVASSNFATTRESTESSQIAREPQQPDEEEKESHSGESLETILKDSRENNHLAQWVRNSHQIPPPDHEGSFEEWTAEELAARTPRESNSRSTSQDTATEEVTTANSDVEQQSTASSASLSTVKSNSVTRKNGSHISSKENSMSSISICRRCHRSGCPTPPLQRDPFSPLPPKISVLPPTPDLCTRHRLRNGLHDSPGRNSPSYTPADGNTEDGSEDDLDCDGEPPYRALRRFGTMSSLDQDDELDEQGDDDNRDSESPPSGLRAWTARASSYVVSKMVLLEQLSEGVGGYLLQPPVPPERTEFSLDPNDEEGTTSGATSGDDIWGTPTSGGPDDESFTANSPPPNGCSSSGGAASAGTIGEDNYGLNLSAEDDADQESENEDCSLPELSMDQLLGGSGSLGSLRCFLGRRRLEPLPEEEDSPGSGKHQVGWW
ncbi:uncharacterized protein LOC105423144 [Pogonomyrmex barbatus]|uniref:Uncharacterized protein LOC105423144 n=1 Tax=Pogonomyrmex barbatus TaxID=144034 RepID=A0A8N1S2V7_9HYME|nr:uncharacterized protein LOC105423144 [Pogonomyrmex barbatus]